MASLLVLVLHNQELAPAVLQAWERIGVPGVTVLESTGGRQFSHPAVRDDLPLFPSMASLIPGTVQHNRTLFTVIADEVLLDCAIEEACRVTGDLTDPGTGIMFVVPVTRAFGVPGHQHNQSARDAQGKKVQA